MNWGKKKSVQSVSRTLAVLLALLCCTGGPLAQPPTPSIQERLENYLDANAALRASDTATRRVEVAVRAEEPFRDALEQSVVELRDLGVLSAAPGPPDLVAVSIDLDDRDGLVETLTSLGFEKFHARSVYYMALAAPGSCWLPSTTLDETAERILIALFPTTGKVDQAVKCLHWALRTASGLEVSFHQVAPDVPEKHAIAVDVVYLAALDRCRSSHTGTTELSDCGRSEFLGQLDNIKRALEGP
jgi:hypothetical protein